MRAIVVVALALLCAAVRLAAQPAAHLVEDWKTTETPAAGQPPAPWRFYGREASPKFPLAVTVDDGRRALRLKTERYSLRLARQVDVDPKALPVLTWEWKAITLPAQGDARGEINDQVGRVMVMFPPRMRPRFIGYVWDTQAPVGTEKHEKQTMLDRWLVVIRSGPADVGKWVHERRNVARDHERLFGGPPSGLMAIGLESHSEDAAHASEILVGPISLGPER